MKTNKKPSKHEASKQVRIPVKLHQALKIKAVKSGMTLGEYINYLLSLNS